MDHDELREEMLLRSDLRVLRVFVSALQRFHIIYARRISRRELLLERVGSQC